jgi:DNA (cytosine-5)-methyltransferase 1
MDEVSLLRMDMRQAAAYWNVAVPIGKRDRKSGAKKRRQWEIEAESPTISLAASSPFEER